jgi:hypothetical protein
MDFDDVLKDVGEFGRYQQLLLLIFILPPCLPGAFHGFSQVKTVASPLLKPYYKEIDDCNLISDFFQ